jgi:hypothetical protein
LESTSRRALLKSALVAPLAALAPRARAAEYASAAEVFAAIDALEAEVESRLRALEAALPTSRAFAASLLQDHARHRSRRAALRRRSKLPAAAQPSASPAPSADDVSLEALQKAVQALVFAHAEGLPALGDAHAVDVMAHDMVDLSRHLTIVELWLEQEQARG